MIDDLEFQAVLYYFEMVLSLRDLEEKVDKWFDDDLPDDIHPCVGCEKYDSYPEGCSGCADVSVHPRRYHLSNFL